MELIRRLLCIPVAGIVAGAIWFAWFTLFPGDHYAEQSIIISVVGLLPSTLSRALPVAAFIAIVIYISPRPTRLTAALFGILSGAFGWPFGPKFVLGHGDIVFYSAEALGTLFGVIGGLLTAFVIIRRRSLPKSIDKNLAKQRQASLD